MKHKPLIASLLLATASLAYASSESAQDKPVTAGTAFLGNLNHGINAVIGQTYPILIDAEYYSSSDPCKVLGIATPDLGTQRVYIKATSISCVGADKVAYGGPIDGFATGGDNKNGIKGELVIGQSAHLADAIEKGSGKPYISINKGDVAIVYITKSTILREQGPAHIAAIPPTKEESLVAPASEKMFAGRLANANNKAPVCEYNSELAAAIQKAYETQSGVQNTNCEGLSREQLMSLDFKAIVFPANYLQNLRDRAESALNTTSGNQLEPNEAITEALDYTYTYAVSNRKASHGEALGASFYKAVEEIASTDPLIKKGE